MCSAERSYKIIDLKKEAPFYNKDELENNKIEKKKNI